MFDRSLSDNDLDHVETHVSVLAFVGDTVHKRKKEVRYGFIDLSTPDLRAKMCEREVELNRRFSPDVYLGVEEVVDDAGSVIDHAVAMRRMPAERRLSTLVHQHAPVSRCLDEIARSIAACHAEQQATPDMAKVATASALDALWQNNIDELASFVPDVLDAAVVSSVSDLAHRYIAGRGSLLDRRIEQGMIVDGHGDLLADDIFCLDDGPRILDCLEFDDELRWGDVLYDVCFLAMDLERLGRPDLARQFLDRYRRYSSEDHPATLEHHYTAYRALVRSKVACLKGGGDLGDAVTYLSQCRRHLLQGRVHLVIVGGLPGTGKTTLATEIGSRMGWEVLHSDVVRKELVGLAPSQGAPADYGLGLYTPEQSAATYAALVVRALPHLGRGESVVIDASFSSAETRDQASRAAVDAVACFTELRCLLPAETAAVRMEHREASADDASDANTTIAAEMARHFDPWPTALPVGMLPPVEDVMPRVLDHICRL